MNIVTSWKMRHHIKRLGIFLIMLALIAGMAGCDGVQYNLTMAVAPGGSGMATDLTNASPYAAGTLVTIKAEANEGYLFAKWGATAGTFANATSPQTTFTMPAQDVIVTADFVSPLISTWYHLDAVRHNLSGNYSLINDLDSTTPGYEELTSSTAHYGKGWQPIGTDSDNAFNGTFNGQGYEISDLFINRPEEAFVGLFGYVFSGIIKDIGVVNVTVTGDINVGGLVGTTLYSTVSNSYSNGNVSGIDMAVGGLVGFNEGTVSNCYSTANVTSHSNGGGLVGMNAGNVSNSYSSGDVTSYDNIVGGLVGQSWGTVSNSYSTGSVTGSSEVGGLVGVNSAGEGIVSNSYSIGRVTGTSYVGGLVGENAGSSIVRYSFWDIETSGQDTSHGGTGKNTTEMQYIVTFSGARWNITAVALNETNLAYIWNIVNNVTYPFLSWQSV